MMDDAIIINEIYQHKNGAIVVRFAISEMNNFSTNLNISPNEFVNMTEDEMREEIERHLQRFYEEKKKQFSTANSTKQKIASISKIFEEKRKLKEQKPL